MKIPLLKPTIPEPKEWLHYLEKSYEQSFFSNGGPCSEMLESRLRDYLGLDHNPVLVSNGTVAIQVILEAMGIKGEVLVPDFTFSATVSSIVYARCTPVLVDLDISDLNMSLENAESLITSNTTAMVVVQSFGIALDYKKYENFAKKHNLKLIFDSAACLGAEYEDGKKVGNSGHPEAFSLHATKSFGIGEGGLVTSNDKEFLDKVRSLINFGFNQEKSSEFLGFNGKISELACAVGLAVLDTFESKLSFKSLMASYYDNLILDYVNKSKRHILIDKKPLKCKAHQVYYILFEDKKESDRFKSKLDLNQIGYRCYYKPIHLQKGLKDLCRYKELVLSKNVYERIVCIPFYEGLSRKEQEEVVSLIYR